MYNKITIYFQLFRSFGFKYSFFRLKYELFKKIGLLQLKFPTKYPNHRFPNLIDWRKQYSNTFIISSKEELLSESKLKTSESLKQYTKQIIEGNILFFSNEWKFIGFNNEYFTHPISKHIYPKIHWTKLPIYDNEIGDIKYVWEKSKFSFLLYIIRNDLRNNEDHSSFVFQQINKWINENPPNIGPQYICSQEISIRLINWCYALFFYQNSKELNDDVLNSILKSIEIQFEHIYNNIYFSKIAVRNNHAVTETLVLYLISLYFPFFKNSKKYKKIGKKWFEKEIAFQLFSEGTDSQYSFNYHRVKIQLLSLAISSARVNNETFDEVVYNRSIKSIEFLLQVMGNNEFGWLPNFGPNDGSIYFKWNDVDYRNFLPQINTLANLVDYKIQVPISEESAEDVYWYTSKLKLSINKTIQTLKGLLNYNEGGYVHISDLDSKTLFKTPYLKFRPAQDDLLHVDIWYKGVNILKDTGSFSYNTDLKTLLLFNGVSGHNSVSLNGEQHMFKGPRFIWLYKPKMKASTCFEDDSCFIIKSKMCVKYPKKYTIERTLKKFKQKPIWEIEDCLLSEFSKDDKLIQYWHFEDNIPFKIDVNTSENVLLEEEIGFESLYYGLKKPVKKIKLSTTSKSLKVTFSIT